MMFRPILVITLVILGLHEGNTGDLVAQCGPLSKPGWSDLGSYCVKYFPNRVPFDQAEMLCRRESSHLISIHDRVTNDAVQRLTLSKMVWIGGIKLPNCGQFIWTDGSSFDYTNWAPGQPDGRSICLQMNWKTPGTWDDTRCHDELGYVCAFKIDKGCRQY
ncbi:lectin-like [Clupea harengus]|uniref:Lectin-like n=1 Tax=Clupea harengus TaxID=7950 RepID=A0A6P3VQS8_CLUHA|nr:lectin-like [Clupea harengus]